MMGDNGKRLSNLFPFLTDRTRSILFSNGAVSRKMKSGIGAQNHNESGVIMY